MRETVTLVWPVALGGYEVVDEAPGLPAEKALRPEDRTVLRPIAEYAGAVAGARSYDLFRDEPALFRTFADTPKTVAGITAFASRYGQLMDQKQMALDHYKQRLGHVAKDEIARLAGALNVVKDPLFSYTLEAWIHLGKVDRVIHMMRPISEVTLSAGVIDPNPTMERYMARVGGLTTACDKHQIERQVIAFPEVLDINTIHAKRLIFQIGLVTGDYERARESVVSTIRKEENAEG